MIILVVMTTVCEHFSRVPKGSVGNAPLPHTHPQWRGFQYVMVINSVLNECCLMATAVRALLVYIRIFQ